MNYPEPPPIDDVIHHLYLLTRRYSHPPRATKADIHGVIRLYQERQVEMYHLVQVVVARSTPLIQAEVQFCRRQVVDEINQGPTSPAVRSLQPKKTTGFVRWYEYQITPEISFDPTITGRFASSKVVDQLKQALHAQYVAVQEILRIHAGKCDMCLIAYPTSA